jgi:phosphate transport system substrate-binding protein
MKRQKSSNFGTNFITGVLTALAVFGLFFVSCESPTNKGQTKNVPVSGVSLNKTAITLDVGGDETLTVTVLPANAANKTVAWISSDTAVATVADGTVTAVTPGTATVTVTTEDGGKTAECTVTVGRLVSMVWIQPGTFLMGSPLTENGRRDNEGPSHWVTLTAGFYMGKYPVTQAQYETVMGSNPSAYSSGGSEASYVTGIDTADFPVETVSWYDAIVFCNKLSMNEGLNPAYSINGSTDPAVWGTVPESSNATWNLVQIVEGSNGYRLPTEAQWEYACRAGTRTAYNTGNTISDNTGWYRDNSDGRTHEVGLKSPNAWGLYDMHGNVFEFCWDWNRPYAGGATDPTGAASGWVLVTRGSSWDGPDWTLRSAFRAGQNPSTMFDDSGFRLSRPAIDPQYKEEVDDDIDPQLKIIEGFTFDNYPKVDGSTSAEPLNILIACKLLGIRHQWVQNLEDGLWGIEPVLKLRKNYSKFWNLIKTSQTHQSFIKLVDKEADITISARKMSPDEKMYADAVGISLIETPVALDAFVIIVNPDNPVTTLTIKQIQDVYTGKITNWKEVGGNDAKINPYVRNANSGSQELMESMVMKDLDIMAFPEAPIVISSMFGAIDIVGSDVNSICYTVFYYKERIFKDAIFKTKSIAIQGIYPEKESIGNNSYPLTAEVYAVIRSDLDRSSTAYKLYELLQTETGKKVIAESEYVPN